MTGSGSRSVADAIVRLHAVQQEEQERQSTWPFPSKQEYVIFFPWQSKHGKEYSTVVAENRRAARAKIVHVYGEQWLSFITMEEFNREKDGLFKDYTLFQKLE